MNVHQIVGIIVLLLAAQSLCGKSMPVVTRVDLQPLAAQAGRVSEALGLLGAALPEAERAALRKAAQARDTAQGVAGIQAVLDRYCLAGLHLGGKKDRIEAEPGPARPELAEQGWRVFLVKVYNPRGLNQVELRVSSPQARPVSRPSSGSAEPRVGSMGAVHERYLGVLSHDQQPLLRQLSGLEVEYRILSLFSRDAGRKEASLRWELAGPDTKTEQAVEQHFLFEAIPAVLLRLRVRDEDGRTQRDGRPVMAAFTFTDAQGRVYPSPGRRLAPDFGFHPQVYRADGEALLLPPGTYSVAWTRGPEYRLQKRTITIPAAASHEETFTLARWIHPARQGWYSGDHHIHAAGCAHYESPTEGVTPEDIMRHVLGEDLNVGCCLSWGPCWYHQKRYFEGKVNALSTPHHLLRYDVEVSGFPSSHCGHLCLLGLREQDYPGTRRIEEWPSWDLPILRWARSQGAVVGFAHSGWGLEVGPISELPNYRIPPMNGIGANEYIVDVTTGFCDFLSTVDTPAVWELNMWYHTLNCGYHCRISGETDFPCIYGERVGLGRSYVRLGDQPLAFEAWLAGIKHGRSYVSDGKSHLLDFRVDGLPVGEKASEVKLEKPAEVEVKAVVAALLEEDPTKETEAVRNRPLDQKPYWDLERARIGRTRRVPVEVVVNGKVVERKEVEADGVQREVLFRVPIHSSSWVCLRIFPSSHTNPVFVEVGGKPIRVSKRSADWCLAALEKCWKEKQPRIRPAERLEAEKAFGSAREAYRRIQKECAGE